MSTTSIKQAGGIKLPVDLTPVQRATLKLWEHFIVIGLFNGVLAGLATVHAGVSWQTVLSSVVWQVILGLLMSGYKYYKSAGQLPLSTLFNLVYNEAAAQAPAVKLDANQQALAQTINDLFAPVYSNAPTDLIGKGAEPTPAPANPQSTSAQAGETINTIPNIAALVNRQTSQQG